MSPKDSNEPTEEQSKILESKNRITVVRAAPGSGKTRVFIDCILKTIPLIQNSKQGVAALSFTNAAQDEISTRLGSSISSPHYIGTLDSFLFRFVVKPFSYLLQTKAEGVRLLASPLDQTVGGVQVIYGPNPKDRICVHRVKFATGTISAPLLMANINWQYKNIPDNRIAEALKVKWKSWKNTGWVTHSDCHFLAASILSEPSIKSQIASIIAHRFPYIFVDEFQDTGTFLSLALTELLTFEKINSLVVGDPDQSIFEFTGANPKIFDSIEALTGSKAYPLSYSRRCPVKVCKAATYLSDTKKTISHKEGADDGKLIMVLHTHNEPLLGKALTSLLKTLDANSLHSFAILSRKNKTVNLLRGKASDPDFKGKSAIAKSLDSAIGELKIGESTRAFDYVSSAVGKALLNLDEVDKKGIEERGIEFCQWKKLVSNLLFEMEKIRPTESWNQWTKRIKEYLETHTENLIGISIPHRFGSKFMTNASGDAARGITSTTTELDPIYKKAIFQTVHQAKGLEYDTVVLYCPKPNTARRNFCPSEEWFGNSLQSEERRIAFVAATRTKKNFILYVHKESAEKLKIAKKEFHELFEEASESAA